jgi:ubiquinone/menaquinone biosynthesis C-methylase UbiE/uncharacterized protein YbaR (Trm112 family)
MEISPEVRDILRCPECLKGDVITKNAQLSCSECHKEFPMQHDGVPDLRAPKMREPMLYQDPHHQQWQKMFAESYAYFSEARGVIGYVQGAGHRHVEHLMRGGRYRTILDLGCGDGAAYQYVGGQTQYIGIDMNGDLLRRLKDLYPDACVVLGDGYVLPMKSRSIDCCINIYNLEHMIYLDLVLEEMARVMTREGDVFISVPNEGGVLWALGRWMTSNRHFTTSSFDYGRAIEIEHVNCIWQLEKAIKRYFRVVRRMAFPFIVPSAHCNLVTTYHCKRRQSYCSGICDVTSS